MIRSKSVINIGISLLATSILIVGCTASPGAEEKPASPEENPKESPGSSYVIAPATSFDEDASVEFADVAYVSSWDPAQSLQLNDLVYYDPVYDKLFYEDSTGEIQPMLATGADLDEANSTVTLSLREGLTFADGEPFNAEAVKFNLERYLSPGPIAGEIRQIANVQVLDDTTVLLQLDGGMGPLLSSLASRPGIMVSPAAAASGALQERPVGIGAYSVAEMVPGEYVTYERTPDYWEPEAQGVAKMKMSVMADGQAMLNAYQSGQADTAQIQSHLMNTIDTLPGTVLQRVSSSPWVFLLNTSRAPLDDERVRLAINHAVNRPAFAEGIFGGSVVAQAFPFADGTLAYNPAIGDGLDVWSYNPEEAKRLLEEAGATDIVLEVSVLNITSVVKAAEALQAQLQDIGIKMNILQVPPPQFMEDFAITAKTDAGFFKAPAQADPSSFLNYAVLPGALLNPAHTSSDALVEAAALASSAVDLKERSKLYAAMMEAWVEYVPGVVTIGMASTTVAVQSHVTGVFVTLSGSPTLDVRYVRVSEK